MNTRRAVILAALLLVLLATATTVVAQGTGYDLSWFTVDGGSGTSQSGGPQAYTLSGTIGQPDAATMSGGGYELSGGFWGGARPTQIVLYLPLVVK